MLNNFKQLMWLIMALKLVATNLSTAVQFDDERFSIKSYQGVPEEVMRQRILDLKRAFVEEFNKKAANSSTLRLGLNHLSDRTTEELLEMLGTRSSKTKIPEYTSKNAVPLREVLLTKQNVGEVPDHVDWREKGNRVTAVKDQGNICSSCWAFSAVGAFEGQLSGLGMDLISLSEQNLLDCSPNNYGCDGGLMDRTFDDAIALGGIQSGSSYPYEGKQSECRFDKRLAEISVINYTRITPGDEEELKLAVAHFGPVAAVLDCFGSYTILDSYKSGVFYDENYKEDCSNMINVMAHAVLVVGYSSDDMDGDYWILKNSWGTDWGEEGYMKLARNRGNFYHIADKAFIPTIDRVN